MAACPLVDHYAREIARIQHLEHAQGAVGLIAAWSRAVEREKDVLREWVDQHGPVKHGGIEWAHRPGEMVRYPAVELMELLKTNGVKREDVPKDVFQLSSSAVKPLLTSKKKWAWIADAIKALAIRKSTGTKFSGQAIVPDEDEQEPTE